MLLLSGCGDDDEVPEQRTTWEAGREVIREARSRESAERTIRNYRNVSDQEYVEALVESDRSRRIAVESVNEAAEAAPEAMGDLAIVTGGGSAVGLGGRRLAGLIGQSGRNAFGAVSFRGLVRNRSLAGLTDTEVRDAFSGTPFVPSNHAISRLLDPRTRRLGVNTLGDVEGLLNRGTVSEAGRGLVSIRRGDFEAIVNPETNVIVTFKPI